MKAKLLLVDGYSLIHRAFYALPPLQTAQGQPTNAVYGFFSMLLRLLEEEQPSHVAVAFDARGPTFRSERYQAYKAHRPDTPDDLQSQFPLVREALEAFQVPVFEREGFEADDVLGTLAERARRDGFQVVIVSGDRDILQLVNPDVTVRITVRGIRELKSYDEATIREEYQLDPVRLIDVKALVGDPSDNIPGVPGIGEKTALKLVRRFGDLEEILQRADEAGGKKIAENLQRYAEVARESKDLVTIRTDVPLEVDWVRCERREPDVDELRNLFLRLEFRSLLDRLGIERVEAKDRGDAPEPATIRAVRRPEEWEAFVRRLQESDYVGVAWRLAGEDARFHPLAFLSVSTERGTWVLIGKAGLHAESGQISVGEEAAGDKAGDKTDGLEESHLLQALTIGLQRAREGRARLVAHDLKPLLRRGLRSGCWDECPRLEGAVFDTQIAAYLLDPSRANYRLRELANQYLGRSMDEPEDLRSGRRKKDRSPWFHGDQGDAMLRTAGDQSRILAELAEALEAQLVGQGLEPLFSQVETPLTEVLAAMEHAGVLMDRQALQAMRQELRERIEQIQAEIYALAGETFNINSTQQLGTILFERLKLPTIKRTKTGFSTDADVLEQLAAEHPVAAKVLEHRSLVKLLGTYVDGLEAEIEDDGRIHSTFQQTVAATGRLASTSPNLQNIPIREEHGRKLRKAFIAPEGCRLVAADYSQIELRVLAHVSKDPRMLESFRRGEDIHIRTAAEVFGVSPDEVTRSMRGMAKAVNFGLIYGQTDFGLARQLGISRKEAREFMDRYFERYAGVRRYLDEVVAEAHRRGYVRSLFGRIRYLPDLRSRIAHRRAFAERTAMNTPIQGTAADLIKMAMVRVHRRLQEENRRARLVLQVHDELILEVPEDELEDVAALVRTCMTGVAELDVPLEVDVKAGTDWYDMKRLEPPPDA